MKRREVKGGSVLPAFDSLTLLGRYIGREYVLSFLVSFAFFFFIFFINQILVFAQRIIIKNVSVAEMMTLVGLYIPQFLMYTFPFSSLTSASMVIGSLSSNNEILAMRSCGISPRRILLPIILVSLVISGITFCVADYLIPLTAQQYRKVYGRILSKVPTVELESYSSTRFGNRVVSNGYTEGNILYDVLILDESDRTDSRTVSSPKAEISLVDLDRLVYRIDLTEPRIMVTDASSRQSYSLASAKLMTMYITLYSGDSEYTAITPSQMSISELKSSIEDRKQENEEVKIQHKAIVQSTGESLGNSMMYLEQNPDVHMYDIEDILYRFDRFTELSGTGAFSFYYQYYRSELNKKIALSAACTLLVLLAFPLSFVRMKYGRLTGFGLSMFAACFYWFFLLFMHMKAISVPVNPALFLWAPDVFVLIVGLVLFWRLNKR